ncbi:hypothetical protein [Corynebacterium sp. LK2510]|uniref:hypothetical protein n=1 Tax=Corynebacterium sp. LK2510 TaxID=3110472 RepID=UPI0034CD82B9
MLAMVARERDWGVVRGGIDLVEERRSIWKAEGRHVLFGTGMLRKASRIARVKSDHHGGPKLVDATSTHGGSATCIMLEHNHLSRRYAEAFR